MARVYRQAEAKRLGLAGRQSLEIVSGEKGAGSVTLRLVEIPPSKPGDAPRQPHRHADFEECIYVLSGSGRTMAENGEHPLSPGDTIVLQPGEWHMTLNTGTKPLMLLCFFPVPDVAARTREGRDAAGAAP